MLHANTECRRNAREFKPTRCAGHESTSARDGCPSEIVTFLDDLRKAVTTGDDRAGAPTSAGGLRPRRSTRARVGRAIAAARSVGVRVARSRAAAVKLPRVFGRLPAAARAPTAALRAARARRSSGGRSRGGLLLAAALALRAGAGVAKAAIVVGLVHDESPKKVGIEVRAQSTTCHRLRLERRGYSVRRAAARRSARNHGA